MTDQNQPTQTASKLPVIPNVQVAVSFSVPEINLILNFFDMAVKARGLEIVEPISILSKRSQTAIQSQVRLSQPKEPKELPQRKDSQ